MKDWSRIAETIPIIEYYWLYDAGNWNMKEKTKSGKIIMNKHIKRLWKINTYCWHLYFQNTEDTT